MENNELKHHGVLGMKWGVRRYQNYDGSLTALGKRRQGTGSGRGNRSLNSSEKTQSARTAEREMKRDVKNRAAYSNQELRERIEHLRLQKELRQLTDEEIRPGRAAFNEVLNQVGKNVATTALTGAALYTLKAVVGGEGKMDWKGLSDALVTGKVQTAVAQTRSANQRLKDEVERLELTERYNRLKNSRSSGRGSTATS